MLLPATIISYDGETLFVKAKFAKEYLIEKQKLSAAMLRIDDGRTLSASQRSKIYAILGEICRWNGDVVEELKQRMELDFILSTLESEEGEVSWFSLSADSPVAADMTTARRFITFLIDFCLEWGVPTRRPLIQYSEDIGRYLYTCLIHRKCCICGAESSDTHHTTAVGMGVNRDEIDHVGMEAMALCRVHHTEAHAIGQLDFDERYKVFGIRIDEYAAEKLRLGKQGGKQ